MLFYRTCNQAKSFDLNMQPQADWKAIVQNIEMTFGLEQMWDCWVWKFSCGMWIPVLDRQHTTAFQWVNVTTMQHVPSYEQGPNVTSNHTLVLFMICHKHSPKISPIIIYVIYLLMAYFVSWQRDIPLICKQIDSTVGNHHTSNTCAACTVHKIKPLWLSFNHVFTSLLKSAEYYEENSLNFLLSYHDVTF